MYDRTALVAAAQAIGDHTPSDIARRLKVARNTAWRLWNGVTAPSVQLAAQVNSVYGIAPELLLRETERAA
ncbi:XRE family transcriptional regulator [Streptomyces zhihengii]